jgi:hypothetical protein
MFLIYGVSVPPLHPLARACTHLRLWSRPDPAEGQRTAVILIVLAWIVYAIAVALLLDVSTKQGNAVCWVLWGTPDAALRLWGIRATLFFVPVCVIAPAIGVLAFYL